MKINFTQEEWNELFDTSDINLDPETGSPSHIEDHKRLAELAVYGRAMKADAYIKSGDDEWSSESEPNYPKSNAGMNSDWFGNRYTHMIYVYSSYGQNKDIVPAEDVPRNSSITVYYIGNGVLDLVDGIHATASDVAFALSGVLSIKAVFPAAFEEIFDHTDHWVADGSFDPPLPSSAVFYSTYSSNTGVTDFITQAPYVRAGLTRASSYSLKDPTDSARIDSLEARIEALENPA